MANLNNPIIRYEVIELGTNSHKARRNRQKVKVPVRLDENGQECLMMLEAKKIQKVRKSEDR